jgi:hypothetical protein
LLLPQPEPVSLDPNHRIAIARSRSTGSRSNPRRSSLIERHRAKGKEGGGAATPAAKTCGGAARDSPELGVPAAPGAKASRHQVREHHRDKGKRSGATAGPRGARASRATVRGGGHRRRAAFQGLRSAKGYDFWCKRTRGRRRSSPRAVEAGAAVEGGRRRGPAAEMVRCLRGEVLLRLSGLLVTGDRCVEVL